MYNRYWYEKDERQTQLHQLIQKSLEKQKNKHQVENDQMSQNYKARVNDFLVKMAFKPLPVSDYHSPITNIQRDNQRQKNIGSDSLFFNGWKSERKRIQKAIQQQQILDLNPVTKSKSEAQFRPRVLQKEIQPQMRFKNIAQSTLITRKTQVNPKMYFKAIQQFGNNLQTMKQKQRQMIGLINRLETIAGPGNVDPIKISMQTLKNCNLLKSNRKQK